MNKAQFDLLKYTMKKGDCLFVSSSGVINDLIVYGQNTTDHTWTNQLGHFAFVDADGNIQESSIDKVDGQWKSGILIRDPKAWLNNKEDQKWIIIMRLRDITDQQVAGITAKGKELQSKLKFYPVRELAGTLVASWNYNLLGALSWINKKFFAKCQADLLKKRNPIDTKKGMYCIAFGNHCYESQGLRLIPDSVDESICKVGDGLRNKLAYKLIFIVPKQYRDYDKEAGQVFDLNINS